VTNTGRFQVFARVKTSRHSEYLQVVENYREGGKVRQRVVLYVGPYESIEHALKTMPRVVRYRRRQATKAEQDHDEALLWGGYPEWWLAERKARAERLRRELDELVETYEALKQLVEEHPELVGRDRARAERHRLRQREASEKRRAARQME
jgi:hypothetical protein